MYCSFIYSYIIFLNFQLPHFKESGVDVSELLYTAFTSPDVRKFEV